MGKRRDETRTAEGGQEASHHQLLRKLSERTRGSGVGVVLTPEEMQALRDLSSLMPAREAAAEEGPAPVRRKTSELAISDEERGVLTELALGEAQAQAQGRKAGGPRRRTTEIEVSSTELELLRRLSYDRDVSEAPAGVQEQLEAAPRAPKRPVTLELTASDVRWLARKAARKSARQEALTDEERRAVEALRARITPPSRSR